MPPSPLTRLRRTCLALPSATEVEAWGAPTFRCGKIFAMYAHPADQHGAGRHGVWLDKNPPWKEIELLVEESWRLVAPKKLLTAYDAE